MQPQHLPRRGGVAVIGAINVDIVVRTERLPAPGETVLGEDLVRHQGGKGANQAVAAARAGASVRMIGAVGNDQEADACLEALATDGVDGSGVRRCEGPSGVALIAVDRTGANQIVVAPGANALLSAADVAQGLVRQPLTRAGLLLASLEVPVDAVLAAVRHAAAAGAAVVINPAPASALPREMLDGAILTPNETELVQLAGRDGLDPAARSLLAMGAAAVVVTRGADGCSLLVDGQERIDVRGHDVPRVVDTTGAGDTFNGVLAAWLSGGHPLEDAARAANAAAALSVGVAGARAGMPDRRAIEAALASSRS